MSYNIVQLHSAPPPEAEATPPAPTPKPKPKPSRSQTNLAPHNPVLGEPATQVSGKAGCGPSCRGKLAFPEHWQNEQYHWVMIPREALESPPDFLGISLGFPQDFLGIPRIASGSIELFQIHLLFFTRSAAALLLIHRLRQVILQCWLRFVELH